MELKKLDMPYCGIPQWVGADRAYLQLEESGEITRQVFHTMSCGGVKPEGYERHPFLSGRHLRVPRSRVSKGYHPSSPPPSIRWLCSPRYNNVDR